MRKEIYTDIPVSWCLELSNDERWFDGEENERLWNEARNHIYDNDLHVKRLHLFSTKNATGPTSFGGVLTSIDPKGVFFCRKVISIMGGPSLKAWAIGEQVNDYELEVRWYTEDMSLIESELRPITSSLIGYIPNDRSQETTD